MTKFYSTKTYGNDLGLSCAFRQWRASSHCQFTHGYSIGVHLIFECDTLDERNWVHDFGGLKEFKKWLTNTFDHKTLVAQDDPHLDKFKELDTLGVLELVIVPAVGCERFAELALFKITEILEKSKADGTLLNPTARIKSVEVFEHGANSAIAEVGPIRTPDPLNDRKYGHESSNPLDSMVHYDWQVSGEDAKKITDDDWAKDAENNSEIKALSAKKSKPLKINRKKYGPGSHSPFEFDRSSNIPSFNQIFGDQIHDKFAESTAYALDGFDVELTEAAIERFKNEKEYL